MSRQTGFSLKAIAAELPAYRSARLTVAQMVGAMRTRVADIDAQIIRSAGPAPHRGVAYRMAEKAGGAGRSPRVRTKRPAQASPALAQRQTRPARH